MTFWCIHGRKIEPNHHIYDFIFSLLLLLVVITFGIYSFGNFGIHITFWFSVTMLYNRSLILTSSFLKPFTLWSNHFPFSQTYLSLQSLETAIIYVWKPDQCPLLLSAHFNIHGLRRRVLLFCVFHTRVPNESLLSVCTTENPSSSIILGGNVHALGHH